MAGAPDYARLRHQMVREDIEQRGIRDPRVLAAMEQVPRERFVSTVDLDVAYGDCALPIEQGQTISQPYTVAFMCDRASPQSDERVLEIGTGSGYGAAILAQLAQHVDTIERIPPLANAARQRLKELGIDNVTVHEGDGSEGLPQQAPFDVIVVTAAAPSLPDPYVEQLNDRGRIVMPIGREGRQRMMLYTRKGKEMLQEDLGPFAFVPLVGRFGHS